MSKLIYVNNVSLDGYCEDENGVYDFGPMDPELLETYNTLTAVSYTHLDVYKRQGIGRVRRHGHRRNAPHGGARPDGRKSGH